MTGLCPVQAVHSSALPHRQETHRFRVDPYYATSYNPNALQANLFSEDPRMRLISIKKLALLCAWLMLAAASALAQSAAHHDVVIKNATVMTVTHGNIKNGSVYVKDGKIAAVGENVNAPASAMIIDAGGNYLTPGIIDSHSHIAL